LKIGFDLQALQTKNSKNRGLGRFSKNLVDEILKTDSSDFFELFLNGNYKDKINVTTNDKTTFFKIDYLTKSDGIVNSLIQFLKYQSSNLDILHILSPFEGYPSKLPVINPYLERLNSILCSTLYDLIPIHLSNHYLSNPDFKRAYFRQLKTIYHSDIIFAISEWTKLDAINLLGINPKKVVNVGVAASASFYHIKNLPETKIKELKKKYGIKKNFILFTGGIDYRKNIEKSIIAFSKITTSLLKETSYVIVCRIENIDKDRLTKLAKTCSVEQNVIFTGYIPDEDLNVLYNNCDSFIFPSLMEGFGLPVLEAMTCGAPVIGSNRSSIPELIEDKQFMFNPENEDEIASLITKMLSEPNFKKKSIEHSMSKSKEYSWGTVAKNVLSSYSKFYHEITSKKLGKTVKKPKIAYFSPLPPRKSGIATYNSSLIPFLSKYWDMDFFIDDYDCTDDFLISNFDVYSYADFEKLNQIKNYDTIVYHFGNSDNHSYMFDIIKKHKGIVVLHDTFLSGVIYWMTGKVGKLDEFIEEVIYSHGEYGQKLVNKAKKHLIPWDDLIWKLPINKRVLDNATKIIVHSQWDKENIMKFYPQLNKKISVIPLSTKIRESNKKIEDKTSLGFSKNDFIICSFGFVVSTKKIDSILKNAKTFLLKNENSKLVIVGDLEDQHGEVVKNLSKKLKINDQVIFTNHLSESEYNKYLDICDVCIQLRKNFRGGGSLTINQALGAGLPTIISDEGSFKEYPDHVVIKVKPNDETKLSEILEDLYQNPQKRIDLAENAKNFAVTALSIDFCAESYVAELDKILPYTIKTC